MSVVAFEGRDFKDVIAGHENEYYLEYGLRDGAVAVTKDILLFVKPKRFDFVDPSIKAQISGVGRSFTMMLKAEAFAKDVEIYFEGIDVILSENYFDITSSAPLKINIMVTGNVDVNSFELEDALRIRCVNTIGKVNKSLKKSRFDAKKQEILGALNFDL
jgi:beta-mannosidase